MEKMMTVCAVLLAAFMMLASCGRKEPPGNPSLALPPGMGALSGVITDGTGAAVPARVYVVGSDDSTYFAADCIPYERPFFAGRIGYSGKHFTTRGNTFTVILPPGRTTVRIERGKEYIPAVDTLEIAAGATEARTYTLSRFIDMAARGWYSGDTHVHRPLGDMAALMHAEDLNVAVPQTLWNKSRADDLDRWLSEADSSGAVTVDPKTVFSVLSHEIERFATGAMLMHHTGKSMLPVAEADDRTPSDISLMEKTHALGGYCEIEKPWWPEAHIDLAVGGGDILGIANNHFTYRSYLPEHPRLRKEFRADYPEGAAGYALYVFDLWYAYLNCGFSGAPTAGSASGVLPNPPGYNRVYVKLDGPFSYEAWFKGLAAGRSFVTNGPLLLANAYGASPGDSLSMTSDEREVEVSCEIHSLVPIEKVEFIRNGSVMATIPNPALTGNAATLSARIPVVGTCWIAVRCFEKRDDTLRFAHTAPIRVVVDNKPFVPKRYAAQYFLKKTRELIAAVPAGKFPDESAKSDALETYRKAEAIYAGMVRSGQ